jgi:hypothetical protein
MSASHGPYLPPRPSSPDISAPHRSRLNADVERFARTGLPIDLEGYLQDAYDLDVSGSYGGRPIRNPWGLASGQLSMRTRQVGEAIDSGLGFVVLKTVIAQDRQGEQSMRAWAIKASRMTVEPIVGRRTRERGWTVSWRGRGWWQSLESYVRLLEESLAMASDRRVSVIPSVKFHLPAAEDEDWRTDEYAATMAAIGGAFVRSGAASLLIEKDFSPTLAGSDRASSRATVLRWLAGAPRLIRQHSPIPARVGLKLFNALFDDDFQLELLRAAHRGDGADYVIYGNRLFDPDRVYDGQKGIAHGGPDLSDRNLDVLSAFQAERGPGDPRLDISGTGNIDSGRMAVEYALRGCSSFQMHTLFQLPSEAFSMKQGSKFARALHRLLFDPADGFIAWMLHAARRLGTKHRLLDVARLANSHRPEELRAALGGVARTGERGASAR